MSRIVVEPDEDAIAGLVHDEAVQEDFRGRMKKVESVAIATAPVYTGEFQESIHLVEKPDPDGTWHVDADADHSYFVEHGTRQTDRHGRSIHPPRYTMSHALDAAGGDRDV
ncbi:MULTISPECIES: HK97 gp10 family phage protein [Streptomyces]|uniref:HK97 gp10 family phage protein n=1 Tax=Streptomyces TaxID=1883 RepID=UPI000E03DEE8|nr:MULTISPECIES: HK97 gp10 family phage protein [Streptomyces]MBT3077642.1 HK97 gp10 family phage protein [Streptomyces sp. COG21]MBT3084488.1 HK97 gp10 family phage protein [Streptomyces sp. COG20]MBT3085395.1 HK97 gp10 family phage protein [Streptomyces sp. CYG21]MBT3098988.1 HK97 gp10 family phage protein [Streptomyces sp. CBG30]MBT3103563.1 HK97 gp10 family phage protein [Streptomyces sp. COG19]